MELLAKLDRDEMGLEQASDCVEEVLGSHRHTYTMDIAPRHVGLDYLHRDGEGGNAQSLWLLAGGIFDVG